jgi:hypothetical protein
VVSPGKLKVIHSVITSSVSRQWYAIDVKVASILVCVFVTRVSYCPNSLRAEHPIAPPFLTSAIVGGDWSALRPGRFTPKERTPRTHWIGSWVGLRVGLDVVERGIFLTLPGLKLQPLGHQASRHNDCAIPALQIAMLN